MALSALAEDSLRTLTRASAAVAAAGEAGRGARRGQPSAVRDSGSRAAALAAVARDGWRARDLRARVARTRCRSGRVGTTMGSPGLRALELGADFAGEVLERVPAGENEVNDLRGDAQLRAARRIEERLQVVRQVPQRVQVQKTGAALQRVEGAKDGIDRVGIGGILLQHQHALLDVLQQFVGFAVEFAKQLGIVRQVQTDRRLICDRLRGRRFGRSRSRVCDRSRRRCPLWTGSTSPEPAAFPRPAPTP